jgi:hypothetical protein
MTIRKLRIAWSVAWGLLAVLLCVLWVRSYTRQDLLAVQLRQSPLVGGLSHKGLLALGFQQPDDGGTQLIADSLLMREHSWLEDEINSQQTATGFNIVQFPGGWRLELPHSFIAIMLLGTVVAPWLRWHFRLRTMLIVTTLISVGLSIVVWLGR